MATTTIPWGDGSGDNIYLTYSASTGDQTVLVSSDANGGAARQKVITFVSTVGNISRSLTVLQESGMDYVSITWNDTCITFDDTAIAYPYVEPYIVFADPNLEAFCANQWGDGVGLKPSQAAEVTGSFPRDIFRYSSYTSFDEFRYFTGLSGLDTYAFRDTAFKSIVIPPNITVISNWDFYQSQLESVTLPDTLTTIQIHAFRNAKLKSVTIPASVTSIGDTAFYNNGNQFTTAVLLPTTPPTCDSSKIFVSNANLKIYVPYSSDHSILDAYKASWTALTSKIYELNSDGTIPT